MNVTHNLVDICLPGQASFFSFFLFSGHFIFVYSTLSFTSRFRFFITSSVLDLTIVGLDVMDGDTNAHVQQPHYLKTCSKPNLELGNVVHLLGYSQKKGVDSWRRKSGNSRWF